MTADDRAKFERGADLLKHVQAGKLFDDYWVPIGDGLLAVRRTVMAALHLKKARGGYYNQYLLDAGNTATMPAKVVQARFDNVRLDAQIGHARGDSPAIS